MNKDKLIKRLKRYPEIQAAILFGSEASGITSRESDIDIALLYEKDKVIQGMDFLQFKEELSEFMHRKVDIVLLNQASPIIAMQVIKKGTPLFINNRKTYQNFEVRLITDYADLKRLREPFERDILKRKLHD